MLTSVFIKPTSSQDKLLTFYTQTENRGYSLWVTVEGPVLPYAIHLSQPIPNITTTAHDRIEPRVRDMAYLAKIAIPDFSLTLSFVWISQCLNQPLAIHRIGKCLSLSTMLIVSSGFLLNWVFFIVYYI